MPAVGIPVVGIIGGIGSGKTAVANAIGELLSVYRLDADVIGHEILKQPQVKQELKDRFGETIFDRSGEVIRSELAPLVFGTTKKHQIARKQLEEVVHPEIQSFIRNEIERIKYQRICDVIILDAALLLEAGWSESCDAIIYLQVPEAVRLQRVQTRGWSEQQFADREASQISLQEKESRSDITINNNRLVSEAAKEIVDWLSVRFHTEPVGTNT